LACFAPRKSAGERALFLASTQADRADAHQEQDSHARLGHADKRRPDLCFLGKGEFQPIELSGIVTATDPDEVIAGAQQPVGDFRGFQAKILTAETQHGTQYFAVDCFGQRRLKTDNAGVHVGRSVRFHKVL
jgi:hypothetical protein